jgi:hypothetical protein
MNTQDLLRYRLHNQQLTRTKFKTPGDVVSWFGAVQSQDYSSAKWAVGQRAAEATDATVENAFTEGAILRTHVMRPTWHFVAPADIRWLLALTAPRVNAQSAYQYRTLGLDDAIFARSNKAMAKALRGGNYLKRLELAMVLQKAGIERVGLGLAYLVIRAELDGIICSGPRRGKQFTYALLDERVPETKTISRGEALAELTRRYFTSHGPATIRDMAWWSGLTVADVKIGIESASPRLQRETVDGKEYWFADSGPLPISQQAFLLPNYDEYTIAYKDRDAFHPAPGVAKLDSRDNNNFNHTIIRHGRIIGMWKRTIKRDSVILESQIFDKRSDADNHEYTLAAHRLGEFLDLPVSIA